MSNRLKAYVRRTLLTAAKEYAAPKTRRTADSTRSALQDATRGTDTGWWCDLIYTAPMLAMAHKHRRDIAAALAEYRDAAGEPYEYRECNHFDDKVIREADILSALLKARRPFTLAEYRAEAENGPAECALLGLRFAVEWYAGEIARELCPDF